MSEIRNLREKLGFTQNQLAEKSKISVRTIQRIESDQITPKGHTLQSLAEGLNIDISSLQKIFNSEKDIKNLYHLKFINLSILSFIIIPFGNLILPFIIWRKSDNKNIAIEVAIKQILNVQILWTLILICGLIVSPFIYLKINSSIPFTLLVLFIMVIINLYLIIKTAIKIVNGKLDLFKPIIQFL